MSLVVTVSIGGKRGVAVTAELDDVYPDAASDMLTRAVLAALDAWAAVAEDTP